MSAACIEIRRELPEVTVQPLPEELQGARWESLPLHYCVLRSDEGFVDFDELTRITEDAFSRWPGEAINDGECEGGREQGNGVNEVGWGNPPEREGGLTEAGFTEVLYQQRPGEQTRIVETDISVDPTPAGRLQNAGCLFSVLLHEAGHVFGVPHLQSPAVMAPVSNSCPDELTDADLAAYSELYAGG